MTRPIIAWSFSALTMFENCPRKYWAVKIGKVVNDENQYNVQGDDEHQSLQHYAGKMIPLPETLLGMKPLLDMAMMKPGQQYVEMKMTIGNDFTPCRWNEWDKAWCRGAGDYVKVNGENAFYLDWKSGKKKSADDTEDQAELTSALLMHHFPQVNKVSSGIVFYRYNQMNPHITLRSDLPRIWNGWVGRVKPLEQAKLQDNWPTTPNPLCGWCPHMGCQHNRVNERLAFEAANPGQKWKWKPL